MAANKRKILEAARKHAQKGARDKALKEYEKLVKLDPRDAKLRLEIGDAYRRWGQVDDAISTYRKVAEQYMSEGFDARAVAVLKQIQNLDPENYATYEPLADLYQRMGLTSEAISALQTAADGYHRAGQKREALELLRKMAGLDPSNTASRLKVADLLRQEGLSDEAVAEYEEAAQELERQGEVDQATKALEKILELDPNRVSALVKIAQNLVRANQAEGAEAFAKRVLDAEPEKPDHYELLAQVYRAQRREDAMADTYRRLAELYRQRGDEDRARDIMQRFGMPGGIAADGGEDLLGGDVSEFLADDDLGGDVILEEDPGVIGDLGGDGPTLDLAEQTIIADRAPQAPSPARDVDAEVVTAPSGDPDQLLAEAAVYLRYGKRAQAIANLEAVLAGDPDHRPALEKLGEAFAEGGDSEAAVEVWLRAARCAQDDGDSARLGVLRDRIAALDAAAAATLSPADSQEIRHDASSLADDAIELELETDPDDESHPELEVEDPEPQRAAEPEDDASLDLDEIEIEIDAGMEGEEEHVAAEPDEPLDLDADSRSAGGSSSSTSQQVLEDLEEAEFYMQQGLHDEAEEVYQRLLKIAPNHPQVLVRLGELAAARGEDPAPAGAEPAEAVQPAAAADDGDDTIGEELTDWSGDLGDSGDFSLGDGDGESTDLELGSADVAAMQAEVTEPDGETAPDLGITAADEEEEPPPPVREPATETAPTEKIAPDTPPGGIDVSELEPPPPAVSDTAARELEMPAAAGDGFDLAAELSDALDDDDGASSASLSGVQGDGFAEVFRAFKKGVSQTLSETDHEAHYDLGIAYREMGLFEDAQNEFRLSAESPTRRTDSLHMMGLCALEQDRPEEAVAHLEAALGVQGLSEQQALPVRFELGRALEAMGERDGAREVWQTVAAVDPEFQGVEERIAALDKAEEIAPEAAAEGFETFDDLLGDVDEGDDDDTPDVPDTHVDFEDLVEEANAAESEPPTEEISHEDFGDLIEDVSAELEGVDSGPDEEGGEDDEPATPPEARPAPQPPAGIGATGDKPRPRRKKKISFV